MPKHQKSFNLKYYKLNAKSKTLIMKTQKVVGILIIILGLYLVGDSVGAYGTSDNHSEIWLGSIFFAAGLWLSLTRQNII